MDDEYSIRQRRSYYFALKVVLSCVPVMALFFAIGRADLARPACLAIGATALAVRQKWEYHRRRWFWVVVAGVVMMHLPILIFFVFPNRWIPALLLMPFALADYVIMIVAIRIAANLLEPQETDE
jgi:ABC-type maltose transport system permease subunit